MTARYWSRLLVVLIMCRLVFLVLLSTNPFYSLHIREGDSEFILAPMLLFCTTTDYSPLWIIPGILIAAFMLVSSQNGFPALQSEKYSHTALQIVFTITAWLILILCIFLAIHHALTFLSRYDPRVLRGYAKVCGVVRRPFEWLHDRLFFGLKGYRYPVRLIVACIMSIWTVLVLQVVILILMEVLLFKRYLNPLYDQMCSADSTVIADISNALNTVQSFNSTTGSIADPGAAPSADQAALDAERKESFCRFLRSDILTPFHTAVYFSAITSFWICFFTNLFMMRQAKILFLKIMTGYWLIEIHPELTLLAVASQEDQAKRNEAAAAAAAVANNKGEMAAPAVPLGEVERMFSEVEYDEIDEAAAAWSKGVDQAPRRPAVGRSRLSLADEHVLRDTLQSHIASNKQLLHAARVATTTGFTHWQARQVPHVALVDPRLHPCAAQAHLRNSGSFIGACLFNTLLVMVLAWLTVFWVVWVLAAPSSRGWLGQIIKDSWLVILTFYLSMLMRSMLYWTVQSHRLKIRFYIGYQLLDLIYLFVGLALGLFGMFARLFLALSMAIQNTCRVDLSLLPKPHKHSDFTYASFISVILGQALAHEYDAVYEKAHAQPSWRQAIGDLLGRPGLGGGGGSDGSGDGATNSLDLHAQAIAKQVEMEEKQDREDAAAAASAPAVNAAVAAPFNANNRQSVELQSRQSLVLDVHVSGDAGVERQEEEQPLQMSPLHESQSPLHGQLPSSPSHADEEVFTRAHVGSATRL